MPRKFQCDPEADQFRNFSDRPTTFRTAWMSDNHCHVVLRADANERFTVWWLTEGQVEDLHHELGVFLAARALMVEMTKPTGMARIAE